jgi:hypothetical protein
VDIIGYCALLLKNVNCTAVIFSFVYLDIVDITGVDCFYYSEVCIKSIHIRLNLI